MAADLNAKPASGSPVGPRHFAPSGPEREIATIAACRKEAASWRIGVALHEALVLTSIVAFSATMLGEQASFTASAAGLIGSTCLTRALLRRGLLDLSLLIMARMQRLRGRAHGR